MLIEYEWTDVTKSEAPQLTLCAVLAARRKLLFASYDGQHWYSHGALTLGVTHWYPIPDIPAEVR